MHISDSAVYLVRESWGLFQEKQSTEQEGACFMFVEAARLII